MPTPKTQSKTHNKLLSQRYINKRAEEIAAHNPQLDPIDLVSRRLTLNDDWRWAVRWNTLMGWFISEKTPILRFLYRKQWINHLWTKLEMARLRLKWGNPQIRSRHPRANETIGDLAGTSLQ